MERQNEIPVKDGDLEDVQHVPIHVRSRHAEVNEVHKMQEHRESEEPTDEDWIREGWVKIPEGGSMKPEHTFYTNFETGERWARPYDYREDPLEDVAKTNQPQEERGLMSQEQIALHEKYMNAAQEQGQRIEHEGLARGLWKKIESISAGYNKIPFKYKIAIAAGLGATSVVASGAVAVGVAGAMIAQRVAGGAATAVAIEALLARSSEKNGQERSKQQVLFHRTMGLVAGGIVGSGQAVEGISYASDKLSDGFGFLARHYSEMFNGSYVDNTGPMAFAHSTPVYAAFEETPPSIDTSFEPSLDEVIPQGEITPETDVQTDVETTPSLEQTELSFTVPEGGTVWDGIREILMERGDLDSLNEQAQNDLIDVYENRVTDMSADELRDIGISSGNPHVIHVGEEIDLSRIFDNTTYDLPDWAENIETTNVAEQAESPAPTSDMDYKGEQPTEAHGPVQAQVDPQSANDPLSQEIFPSASESTEMSMAVEESMQNDLNELYGHLGVGRSLANPVVGAESIHWIGPNGISESAVGEIMKTNPESLSVVGNGTLSSEAVRVTQERLKDLAERSGETFRSDESVQDYMNRAHEALLDR